MGRGKKRSVFAFFFGFRSSCGGDGGRKDEAAGREEQRYYGHQQQPWGRTTTKTKVRPSDYDDDNYYGRQWYAERDIDRRASEFIDRVHRGMLATGGGGEQDG